MMRKLILSLIFFVLCSVSVAGAEAEKKPLEIPIGKLGDFQEDVVKPLPLDKIIVFKDKDGIYCISSECTHRGCVVTFKRKDKIFACPCHGANFSEDGAVTRGPAKKNLNWYAIRLVDGDKLIVDKSQVVAAGTKFKFDN